jgi:hypothetical protein
VLSWREARIELGDGVPTPWSPVDCLARADVLAEKILANSGTDDPTRLLDGVRRLASDLGSG